MRVLFKKIKNNSIFHSIILVLVAFVFGIFINRGISTSVTSLGLYYQELSQTLPNFEGTRFPQRILLPLLSFITNLDVQILNIIFLFLFLLSVDYYFQKKLDFLLRFLYLIGLSTTMVFQFTIIYGGYPDILSLLLYVFALKNLDNHKCYLYLFLNLLTREAAIVMLPIFFLIKGNENFINKLKNFTLLVIIYLPIYFYFEQSDSIDSNGWEFYLLPLQDDLFFWFNKSSEFYWLGLFSSVKFFLILIPFIIKSFNDILLLIISIFCINIQFIVSGGDNTRYWLLLIIPIIYLTFHNLDSNKVMKSFFVLIIILNIITPKYYVFSDAYEGSMYVRPNDSRIHFFDIQNLVFNKINFTNLFK
tara:strand:- start:183 stop:1265 length:1083 start_codon:yes stop_codon:yes gene_type:complete